MTCEFEAARDGYEISDGRARLDLDVVHGFLTVPPTRPGRFMEIHDPDLYASR